MYSWSVISLPSNFHFLKTLILTFIPNVFALLKVCCWRWYFIRYFRIVVRYTKGLPRWFSGKESTCQCRRPDFDPWVGKIPWRRKWQPTPVFSSGKSHGQRAAVHGVASVGYDLVTKQQQDTHKFTSLPVFDVQFSGITYIQSLVQTSLLIYHPKRKLCPH